MSNTTAIEAMKSRARAILVAELKIVCRDEGLAVSGAKATLQYRIINRIDQLVATSNSLGLASMRQSLQNHGHGPLPPLTATSAPSSTTRSYGNSSGMGYTNGAGGLQRHISTSGTQFRPSPFFESLEPLAKPVDLPPYPNHRNQVTINFQLQQPNIDRLRDDSSLRILLYCAAKSDLANGQQSDVSFPSQLEVKVNDQEVRANFKGLKNKPGSTRPADITGFVTKQPGFQNRILTTYALTQKVGEKPSHKDAQGFTMVALLVKKRSVDDLVARIQRGKVISRQTVLNEMQMRAKDPDIVVSSSVMTLKDPVSYMRIAVPCRSDVCSHHQCFDAASFLQLQEQAPTWTCPICNKTVSFEGLVVDQYFEDILRRTSTATYQVTVEPNGQWSASAAEKSSGRNGVKNESSDDNSDSDLIEVVKPVKRESVSFGSNVTPATPYSMVVPTPPRASPMVNSAAGSTASVPRQGQKRKSEVIDLTLSDEDQPAPKRPAYSTPTSLPDHGRTGRTNGYQSYPNHPPSFSNRANGPLRFQIGNVSSDGSGSNSYGSNSYGSSSNTYNNQHHDYSNSSDEGINSIFGNTNNASFAPSRSAHRPSPLSGTALAPINLSESPPHRPPSALYLAGSSAYGLDQQRLPEPPTLPRFDFGDFPSPPPVPPSQDDARLPSSAYRDGQPSEQRNILRQLANPFRQR